MKIISWNVNGIRACYKKGLLEFAERENADILCLQETKAHIDQVDEQAKKLNAKESYWSSATRKGYSGVATFVQTLPAEIEYGIGIEKFDSEGRIVATTYPDFILYNIYFPNGGAREERHLFKQEFLKELNIHLKEKIDQGKEIIVLGDYNVAHREIDVYDPVKLSTESGFLPEEREWFDQFLNLGFVDTFRHLHPDEKNRFSWWSYRERARLGNRGWRIDSICVTQGLIDRVKKAEVMDHVMGSDHCPVSIEMEPC